MTSPLDDLLAGIKTPAAAAREAGIDLSVGITPVETALDLFDFQVEAVNHVLRDPSHPYAYVALDMGLGKSPVGATVAASAIAAGQVPFLIVVPPSLRINWIRELHKFTPWLSVATIKGKTNATGEVTVHGVKPEVVDHTYGLPQVDVFIMGDSSVDGWADYLVTRGKLAGLIVDEAHRFKNKSKRGAALVKISESIMGYRVMMSGTPMPNGRHHELAQQIDVMGAQAWKDIGGIGTFWQYYCPKIDQWGGRGNNDSEGLGAAMRGSWMIRRRRDEVIELPAKGRASVALEGKGRAVAKYRAAEQDLIEYLRSNSKNGQITAGQRRAQALIKMTTLRKLAGESKLESAVDHIKDILDNEPGGVFVVAEHRDVIDYLIMKLMRYNSTFIMGGMTDAQKAEAVDDFNSGEARVLIGQITAAGVGLTLHGDGGNHRVVVVQLPWTPAELTQAEDRLHRIGQTHDVMVEVCLAAIDGSWTIDERLWGVLESKYFNTTLTLDDKGEYLLDDIVDGVLDTYR